jgi:hypothetical protein
MLLNKQPSCAGNTASCINIVCRIWSSDGSDRYTCHFVISVGMQFLSEAVLTFLDCRYHHELFVCVKENR